MEWIQLKHNVNVHPGKKESDLSIRTCSVRSELPAGGKRSTHLKSEFTLTKCAFSRSLMSLPEATALKQFLHNSWMLDAGWRFLFSK